MSAQELLRYLSLDSEVHILKATQQSNYDADDVTAVVEQWAA